MSYVSNNLCHFVGRSQTTDEDRFNLLVKIMQGKILKANVIDFGKPQISSRSDYSFNRVGEVFLRCDCVCFCDIPDDMLKIHTGKYSEFGLGFDKHYLAAQGVRPVVYVPLGAVMKEHGGSCSPKENPVKYYSYLEKLVVTMDPILMKMNQDMPFMFSRLFFHSFPKGVKEDSIYDKDIGKDFMSGNAHGLMYAQTTAMLTHLAFVKMFDETLKQEDPENYYMEREWRALWDVEFAHTDVKKIYLPSQAYKKRFMDIFPEYKGEFWIFDEHRNG